MRMSKLNYIVIVGLLFSLTLSNTSAQNTNLVDIKTQAEQDTRADVNQRVWFTFGGCVSGVSCCLGIGVGLATGKKNG